LLLAGLVLEEAKALRRKGACKLSKHLLKEMEDHALAMLDLIREMRAYLDDRGQE